MTTSFLQKVHDHYGEPDPLDLARRLVDQGVPVFVAPPDTSSLGFRLPRNWQATKADPRALDTYEPGWAVCAVGGHTMDVLDVDPRHGGDTSAETLRSAGGWPREYAIVSTPSGGTHHYVAALKVAKASRDGIDLQAGAPDGTGRGFVFLPPTIRAGKDGIRRPYTLVVDGLDTFGQNDDTGAAFRSWVTSAKAPATAPDSPWSAFDAGVPDLGTPIPNNHDDELSRYAAHVVGRFPGITLDEAVPIVVARGQDCVPPWAGPDTLEHCARTRWVPSALKKYGRDPEPVDETLSPHERAVAEAAGRLRVQGDARRIVDRERVLATFRQPESQPTLVEELAIPDTVQQYAIDRLLPAGGNAMLAAQFKAGKTTLLINLARAIADRRPFLGRFDIAADAGAVALFNYEVGSDQFRRWLRDAQIEHPERVAVLNLRGHALPITVPDVEDWTVEWLRSRGIRTWIVDPLGRALGGADENDNTAVRTVLDALDTIKARAGVSELIVAAHVGRQNFETGQERVRGATVLDDWPDARWLLTRDETLDSRFLRATGRDVEVEEEQLTFDLSTRRLSFGGWDRNTLSHRAAIDRGMPLVLQALGATPGMGVREIRDTLRPMRNDDIDAALREALRLGRIETRQEGRKKAHYLAGTALDED